MTPLPLSEAVLCRYVSFLADQGLKHSTIKVYLSAARYMQISAGLPDLFAGVAWPRLDYVTRGVKKNEAEKGISQRPRLPITPSILHKLREVWAPAAKERNTKMIWAACCLGFFGFLRAGEMTTPGDSEFDPAVQLSVADIAVDDAASPAIV